jgi:L-ascorbate metabolism protein UlaG (beta-lactamase superfamily)
MGLIRSVIPNTQLVSEKLPVCDFVLVTHSHWDHLMDVPQLIHQTGAMAYGSANTCQLLSLLGARELNVKEVQAGVKLSLGEFMVEVVKGRHSPIPFSNLFNGKLGQGLHPPLHLQDYRMDVCLGYRITTQGVRVLVCPAEPIPADLLFTVAQEPKDYYQRLFLGVHPHTLVPIHWDNFLRPLSKPLHKFTRPGRMNLLKLTEFVNQVIPQAKVIIPEIFKEYTLGETSI